MAIAWPRSEADGILIDQAARQPLPEDILQEAATWMMEMHEGPLAPKDRVRFNQWRLRSKEHELAWQKASVLLEKFQSVSGPGAIALKSNAGSSRRATIKTLAALLALGPLAWAAYRYSPWGDALDVVATGRGERRDLVLEDGTRITLNTATEIRIRFDEDARHIRLLSGELLVATAKDARLPPRPFIVQTAEGSLRPVGTRFTARQLDGRSQLAVYEGAVEVAPLHMAAPPQRIRAGEQVSFSQREIDPATRINELSLSWTQGMLVVDRMPLSAFAAELQRYRPGLLQVDARVGSLPVSGVFPLADTGAGLTLLEQTMPVRIQYLTRYWARIGPK